MNRAFWWSGASPGGHNGLICIRYLTVLFGVLDIRSMVPYDQGARVSIYGRISPKAHMHPPFCIDT